MEVVFVLNMPLASVVLWVLLSHRYHAIVFRL